MLRSICLLAAFTLTTGLAAASDDGNAAEKTDGIEALPTRIVPPQTAEPSAQRKASSPFVVQSRRPAAAPPSESQPQPARANTDQPPPPRRPFYGRPNSYSYFRAYAGSGLSQHQIEDLRRLAVGHAQQDSAFVFNQIDMNIRATRLLSARDQALQSGLQLLKRGDYKRAVLPLTLATKLDQGDPAARIHLAQARLALGHYDQAAALLRRALQLQPRLIYADLQLADYLPDDAAMTDQARSLADWTRDNPTSGEVLFLLGYFEFQLGDFDAAYRAFARAAVDLPRKDIVLDYLEITRPQQLGPQGQAKTSARQTAAPAPSH